MGEPLVNLTYLLGDATMKRPTYKLIRHADGHTTLETEFMVLQGDFDDLLLNAALAGMRITEFEDRRAPKFPSHSHSFWASLKETFLDWLIGRNEREGMRRDRETRARADATVKRHMEAARNEIA